MCRDIRKPRGPGETTGRIVRKDNHENAYIVTRRQPFDKGDKDDTGKLAE